MSSICLYAFSMFVNCPAVICSPSMLFIQGEPPLVKYGSRSLSFTFNLQSFTTLCLLSANFYFFPFDTFNTLFSAKHGEIDNLIASWGQSSVVVLCRSPRCY